MHRTPSPLSKRHWGGLNRWGGLLLSGSPVIARPLGAVVRNAFDNNTLLFLKEFIIMKQDKPKTRISKVLRVQERDIVILKFLDRVGYANIEQITLSLGEDASEKAQAAILRRLYLLRRFDYIKAFATQYGNYYAVAYKGKGENSLINNIKLDQLAHHNFLTELFIFVKDNPICTEIVSEREAIAMYKVVGKKGKIPDMIVNNWVIEYERTSKSVTDSKDVVHHWTIKEGRNLCVIYETNEIKNRYTTLLNPRVKLLSRSDYKNIIKILSSNEPEELSYNEMFEILTPKKQVVKEEIKTPEVKKDDSFLSLLKNKYS